VPGLDISQWSAQVTTQCFELARRSGAKEQLESDNVAGRDLAFDDRIVEVGDDAGGGT
jgi:hypothetical protein